MTSNDLGNAYSCSLQLLTNFECCCNGEHKFACWEGSFELFLNFSKHLFGNLKMFWLHYSDNVSITHLNFSHDTLG